ncbi:type II toxin-antitoxin system PemK/MazF family toxin [Saccharopolyspora sp. NPDC000995]
MSRKIIVEPWQVWLTDLGEPVGSEHQGVRPSVVVASELHCRFPIDMTMIVPLTTRNRGLPHHVLIQSAESGLHHPSWARTDDVRSISTQRFTRNEALGVLSEQERSEVRRWLHRMLV